MEGWLNIVKPPGMTSHDLVGWGRRLTGIKRIGHTGTLDPAAAGVVVLALGKATRLIEYLPGDKEYRAEILLGAETDSDDKTGRVTAVKPVTELTSESIAQALVTFRGRVIQRPPVYSAVKKQGVPAYKRARRGEIVLPDPRPVDIYDLKLINLKEKSPWLLVLLDIHCSAGTYIRSLARDLGRLLECGGTLNFLLRRRAGAFPLHKAVSLEEAEEGWPKHLLPLDYPLGHIPKATLEDETGIRFSLGQKVACPGCCTPLSPGTPVRIYRNDKFLGLGITESQGEGLLLKPEKVIL